MKKIVSLALLSMISLVAFSQEKGTNEININVGFYTINDLALDLGEIVTTTGTLGTLTYARTTTAPTFGIAYESAIKNNWFFYADAYYQTISEDVFENDVKIGDINNTFITVGFGTNYRYIHGSWFQVYSGASIAWTSLIADYTGASDIEDSNNNYFNFHIDALAVRLGSKFAATVAAGYGYKGILNAGLSLQF